MDSNLPRLNRYVIVDYFVLTVVSAYSKAYGEDNLRPVKMFYFYIY